MLSDMQDQPTYWFEGRSNAQTYEDDEPTKLQSTPERQASLSHLTAPDSAYESLRIGPHKNKAELAAMHHRRPRDVWLGGHVQCNDLSAMPLPAEKGANVAADVLSDDSVRACPTRCGASVMPCPCLGCCRQQRQQQVRDDIRLEPSRQDGQVPFTPQTVTF